MSENEMIFEHYKAHTLLALFSALLLWYFVFKSAPVSTLLLITGNIGGLYALYRYEKNPLRAKTSSERARILGKHKYSHFVSPLMFFAMPLMCLILPRIFNTLDDQTFYLMLAVMMSIAVPEIAYQLIKARKAQTPT